MAEAATRTMEKALAINLDSLKYGTVVEIGAGQEVARWFFQAGAAAGTIAKTMSAYDMNFSDEIYGAERDRRYVARPRLERMLAREYDLIISRIKDRRPEDSTFFAFANTVAARGFKQDSECHGWLGIQFQSTPKSPPDNIVLHVRLLDDTNLEQQEALGILGVNLIYGAFFLADTPERLVRSLMDSLKWGRIEIDLVEFSGPTLGAIDNYLMALELVKASLVPAVMFDSDGDVVIPAEAFYKRRVLAMRGEFKPVLHADMDMFERAREQFLSTFGAGKKPPVFLAEMTMAHLANDGEIDTSEFLSRVDMLTAMGFHVLISEYFRYFRVRQYLARHTREPVAIVTDVEGFSDVMREDYYEGLSGGILEALGKLFPPVTTVYVCPSLADGSVATLDTMPIADHLRPILAYLRERGNVVSLGGFDPARLKRNAPQVLEDLRSGGNAWREGVPPEVQNVIVEEALFGYQGD